MSHKSPNKDMTTPPTIATARPETHISTGLHATHKCARDEAEVVRHSLADQECYAQALLSPVPPNAALKRAFAHRSKLLCTE